MAFEGIMPEGLLLLSEIRFHNSKDFYEAKKPAVQKLIMEPMRALIADVADTALQADREIVTDPKRIISRIRRDTRFTKDKSLYRDHVWWAFARPKTDFPVYPGFWFEIASEGYRYGAGFFACPPDVMALWRQKMLAEPERCRKIIRQTEQAGFRIMGDNYKKEKPGDIAEDLKPYYNRKACWAQRDVPGIQGLAQPLLVKELAAAFKTLTPLYQYMLEIALTQLSLGK